MLVIEWCLVSVFKRRNIFCLVLCWDNSGYFHPDMLEVAAPLPIRCWFTYWYCLFVWKLMRLNGGSCCCCCCCCCCGRCCCCCCCGLDLNATEKVIKKGWVKKIGPLFVARYYHQAKAEGAVLRVLFKQSGEATKLLCIPMHLAVLIKHS